MENAADDSSSGSGSDDEAMADGVIPLPDVPGEEPQEGEFDFVDFDAAMAGAVEDDTTDDESEQNDDASRSNDEVDREPFNTNLPSTHQYLQLARADDAVEYKPQETDSVMTVSIIELPIVMFPNQFLPFHAEDSVTVRQLLEASRTGALIALKPAFPSNSNHIATLIQIAQVSTRDDEGVSIHAVGRQRCRVLEERSAINGMKYGDVKVLDDDLLPPFTPPDISRALARLRPREKNFVDRIVQWLSSWYPGDKIQSNLAQGLTSFSYWVAANIPADIITRLELLEESCTDRRLINECNELQAANEIVCKRCKAILCRLSDIISVSTEGNSALYVNPGGYVHDMFTVSKLSGTRSSGSPSSEYSWFPGYQWTIQHCAQCRNFIGWRFTSGALKPRFFYGITRNSVSPKGRIRQNLVRVEPADEYLLIRL